VTGYRSVVFDLDGTLVDSSHDIAAALNRVLEPLGGTALTAEAVSPLLGEGVLRLIEGVLRAAGLAPSEELVSATAPRYLAAYRENPVSESTLYGGVAETLHRLAAQGIPMGVCTNKNEAIARQVLAGLGVDGYFAAVVGADRLANSKPHPDHLFQAFGDLGQDPATGMLVGDSVIDERCATSASVDFYAVPWAPPEVPGARLTHFADLADLVGGETTDQELTGGTR
jgi:phosphoglycolate phosphatase